MEVDGLVCEGLMVYHWDEREKCRELSVLLRDMTSWLMTVVEETDSRQRLTTSWSQLQCIAEETPVPEMAYEAASKQQEPNNIVA